MQDVSYNLFRTNMLMYIILSRKGLDGKAYLIEAVKAYKAYKAIRDDFTSELKAA